MLKYLIWIFSKDFKLLTKGVPIDKYNTFSFKTIKIDLDSAPVFSKLVFMDDACFPIKDYIKKNNKKGK